MQTSQNTKPSGGSIDAQRTTITVLHEGAPAAPAAEGALTIDAREAGLMDEALIYLGELRESPTRADPGLADDIERIERLRNKLRRFIDIDA